MPYYLPLDQIEHHFCHVGSMVGDALEVLSYKSNAHRPADYARIFSHQKEKLAQYLVFQVVDLIIPHDNVLCKFHVPLHKSIECIPRHSLCDFPHPWDIDIFLED